MDYKNWFAFKGNVELKALDKKATASGFCLPHIVAEYARADKLYNISRTAKFPLIILVTNVWPKTGANQNESRIA